MKRRESQLLSWGLTAASRSLMMRDRLSGVTRQLRKHEARQEFFLESGGRRLACVYVPAIAGNPVVLLCHGIGETVGHWSAVQALFRDHGIGSLVFNYSGYGKSTGQVSAKHCNEDLVAAYAELRRRVGSDAQTFVLGFSLGSGIAACGVSALQPPVSGLFLCEAFDSFREAACAAGVPRSLAHLVPDIWVTVSALREVRMSVWVIHSDGDHLFPLAMPRKIVNACGPRGELIVVEGFAHNEPYLTAAEAYWRPVIERMLNPLR